ncbi:response regulator, partial [Desulfosporosinus sp. OT]|uniref:response regulator transcription factor n=1 Tax=Desulfosporosinus sp. OT TaxID=913865 RepID=UPI0002239C9F
MGKKSILIIEDEENIADILAHCLENEGFKTIVAGSGEQGLALVQEFVPDLVLLDIMLPDISGLEVCKRITASYIIPVIMLTARADDVDKILGMELGADDYITKPFNLREVMVRIKTIFRRIDLIAEAVADHDRKVLRLQKEIEIYIDQHEIRQH